MRRFVFAALAAGAVLAAPAPASAQSVSQCLETTKVNSFIMTGSPYAGGTTLTWNTTPGCAGVVVALGGNLGAKGKVTVNPELTTEYRLYASRGKSKRLLASRVVLAGKVFDYAFGRGGPVASNATGPDGDAARLIADKIARTLLDTPRRNLLGKALDVHIIPSHAKLTALPPWQHLAGEPTCELGKNGCTEVRLWDDVRGVGGTEATGNPRIATAVAEEELVAVPGKTASHRLGHIMAHEFSHVFLQKATAAFRTQIQEVLTARGPNADYLGLDHYTKSNIDEYWAEGSAAFFGYAYSDAHLAEFTETWLKQNDPQLLAKLRLVYSGSLTIPL